jgi:hypothetical protein
LKICTFITTTSVHLSDEWHGSYQSLIDWFLRNLTALIQLRRLYSVKCDNKMAMKRKKITTWNEKLLAYLNMYIGHAHKQYVWCLDSKCLTIYY